MLSYHKKVIMVRKQFQSMFRDNKATQEKFRKKLEVISQTEEQKDRFFVGEAE